MKENQIGQKPKARLIIKGYQDPDLLLLKRDSPTLSTQNRNMILALAASNHWDTYLGDVKTAFNLNGDKRETERQIYAEPPEEVKRMLGMKEHELFRIHKAVYGLLHAPRAWADKLAKELANQGWIRSRLEPCVWRLYDSQDQLCRQIGCHVDDLICCGAGAFFKERIQALRDSFPFGAWKALMEEPATLCGCELKQDSDYSIELNQERYAEGINEILFLENVETKVPNRFRTRKEASEGRSGSLSWRATQSAPGASVSYLQGCYKEATVDDLLQANKLIRNQWTYSQTTAKFSAEIKKPALVTFHDASWACRRDGSSQGGILTLVVDHQVLEGKAGNFLPLAGPAGSFRGFAEAPRQLRFRWEAKG